MGCGPARVRRRWLPIGLCCLVVLTGTAAPVLRDAAARALGARQGGSGPTPSRLNRLPAALPLSQTEPPDPHSGAHGPYPLNHTFDGESYLTGEPPANHDFGEEPEEVGTPAANYDFAAGNLSDWTTSGTVSYQTEGSGNGYGRLGGSGILTTAAVTIDDAAQTLTARVMGESVAGDQIKISLLSGPTFGTSTFLAFPTVADGAWTTLRFKATPWRGQTVKLKFEQF